MNKSINDINIGDIFVSSWGYDQTNIDFYQVIARTKKMVTVRMIRSERVGTPHSMGAYVMPRRDCFLDSDHPYDEYLGKPLTRKLLYYDKPFFKADSCRYAYLWDGTQRTETYTG